MAIAFPPQAQKRLIQARDKLSFAPYGILSDIAREVSVERQYVHSVIRDSNTFTKHHGEKAQQIWFCLEKKLNEDPHVEHVEKIVTALKAKKTVNVRMSARFFNFLNRRLKRLGVDFEVSANKETPATYSFKPTTK